MNRRLYFLAILIGAIALSQAPRPAQASDAAKPIQAGLATVVITPDKPTWMAGYAARTKPSEGKIHDLYAKALAIADARGNRIVLVTTDLLGLPGALSAEIAEHANKRHGLKRGQVLFNSSHTHTGPVLAGSLAGAYDLDAARTATTLEYTRQLKEKLIQLIGDAVKNLAPARLSFGRGTAPFAMNRRQLKNGAIVIGVNPEGVVDREVPVLRVESMEGTPRGIAFGYACHNTTLTGEFYELSGDYAGFAQEAIEKAHPGATALFVMGCGADINPNPRSSLEIARLHGESLAQSVAAVLNRTMTPVTGKIQSAIGSVMIPFATPPTKEEFQARLNDPNVYKRRHAQRWIARYEREGKLKPAYPYTIQVIQIGPLTMVGLAGEVVTDYALRLKRELGGDVWVAGYSNDVCSYIPSARMFKEGGYEVIDSQLYYDMPGPYDPALEERIIAKTHELARRIGRSKPTGGGEKAQSPIEKKFRVAVEAEAMLDLTASAPNTSWMEKDREAATVTIFVDGQSHQDVILFHGARRFTYRRMLGRLSPGDHTVRVELNREQSAANAASLVIHDIQITMLDRAQPEFQALAHAPILYARPNTIGRFSDVPLLMYYETERRGEQTTLRYTVIFSNEDGGTQTAALMARWGRTTDIEWVIETTLDAAGKVVKSIYQGVNHETKAFQGKREADHPLLITASDNNNFADDRESEMRFALRPVPFDLSRHSREEVMDRHPWMYRVMAEEMIREGKISEERKLGARIADLRRYLYLDAASDQQGGTGLSFAVKLKGAPQWLTSDLGVNANKIDRGGYFRTTIRLPAGVTRGQIERIAVRCDVLNNPRTKEETIKASASGCALKSVSKAFLLDRNFQPSAPLHFQVAPVRLQFGEMLELNVRQR